MDTTMKNKSFIQPKTMAEMLPAISGILSKDAVQYLTAKKKPPATIEHARTAEKVIKPMTIAEMRTNILALRIQSPKRNVQPNTSTKKKKWNSTVKIENKMRSVTADGQLKHNSVRKVLNFQPKSKPVNNARATLISSETPKFPKPELRAKKTLHLQAKNSVRISGVYNIPPTPVTQNKPAKPQFTLNNNKENKPYQANINRRTPVKTPKNLIQKKFKQTFPDTPLANLSYKSNGDASFLLKEKEINDMEEKAKVLTELDSEDIAEVPPPVSTPFKEYRDVQEFFNNTCDVDDSCNDNTIMCFDKASVSKENSKREESVIVSLCDMLKKASVTATEKTNTELNDLLEVEKRTENNIRMIENGINTLNNIKESQISSLQYVRKLISERNNQKPDAIPDTNSDHMKIVTPLKKEVSPERSPIHRPSVIKTKSPSYKIPRKSMCLRKKVIHKSMPDISEGMKTPIKSTDKVLNMYMQLKEKMNFLNTPLVKQHSDKQPDTPSITSHNLQQQLDKLYNGS